MNKKWIGIGVGIVVLVGVIALTTKNTKDTKSTGEVLTTEVAETQRTEEKSVNTMSPASQPSTDIEQLKADASDAMSRKAYDKARTILEAVMAQTADPDEKMVVGQSLYECLIRTHAYEEALALGRELLALNPSPDEELLMTQQLAALLQRMGRSDEAEALLNDAMGAEDDPAVQEKLQAQRRSVQRHTPGRMDEVVSNLTVQVENNPQDEDALRELGAIYLKSRRDYEAAKPVYEKLAELNPDDPQIESALLGIYRQTRDFDGMRSVYESRLQTAGGDDSTLHLSIAQTDLMAGKGDDAVAYAEEHLAGDDATPFELQMLSSVYDKAERKEEALNTLSTAIERSDNAQQKVSMQFQKADMLIWTKQYDEAEALLRSIREANKDDKQTASRVNSELIRIYQMQGKMGEIEL